MNTGASTRPTHQDGTATRMDNEVGSEDPSESIIAAAAYDYSE
jgi:hypothetical protein